MKVAFFTYPSAFQNIGGGEIQLLKTKEYLEKEKAIEVDFFNPWNSRIENYDILHVFGSVKDCLGLIEVAKSRKVKVVTSTVLWSDFRRALHTDGGFRQKADLFLRHALKAAAPNFPSSRRRILVASDLLFPNSEAEKSQIVRLFNIPKEKIRVVPNGVDERFADAEPSFFREKHGAAPFILSVGRIEPRKNQLNLIKAMKKIKNLRLFIVGSPVSGYEKYYAQCRREASANVFFLETLPHDSPLLSSAYAGCDVFVLQSWFETPGLVALEAALAGANLAVTSGGSTREYFLNHVEYLDPASPNSMAQAIRSAAAKPKSDLLKNHVRTNYIWNACARRTIECYQEVLR